MFGFASTRDLVALLVVLRWMAVAGQLGTIVAVAWLLGWDIPVGPLLGGVAALAVFNVVANLRVRMLAEPFSGAEVFVHMSVDVTQLSYMLALTGGPENPFFPLHLVPIALAASALALPWVVATAAVTLGCATISLLVHLPLPASLFISRYGSVLHQVAIWVSFALSLGLLVAFMIALRRRAAEQAQALREWRERALRGESVVALASQAASVAHELNTPLGTVANVVADLRRDYANDEELGPDLRLIDSQLGLCRDYIRELVAISQQDAQPRPQAAGRIVELALSQFRLLHPAVEVSVAGPSDAGADARILADRSVVHLLVGLLNNAADAMRQSEPDRPARIELHWQVLDGRLRVSIRDFGPGLSASQRALAGAFGFSTKPQGLGLGLTLGHLTVERFAGSLTLRDADGGGTLAEFELPLVAGGSSYDAAVPAAPTGEPKGGLTA